MSHRQDHYAVLEVAPHARAEVIEAAFVALREICARDDTAGAARRLAELNRAHAVLTDVGRRMAYDRERGS